jgi:2'-5' RNA ligase
MAERTRAFAALEIDTEQKRRIGLYCDELRARPGAADWRWVRPEIVHITVRFFGDLDRKQLGRAQRAIQSLDRAWDTPNLRLGRLGAFPSLRRPQVLWLGIDDPDNALPSLAEQADRAIRAQGFGAPDKRFVGHLTVARARKGRRPSDLDQLTAGLTEPEGALTICSITLYRSDLRPEGPLYTPLEVARSRGAPSTA